MASTASISGLASGLDTTTIVSQLMAIEQQPQKMLQTQLTNTQTDAAAYRDINTSFAALGTAAQALTKAATWTATKAGSSNSSVTATAAATATAGSLTFTVNQLAAAKSVMSGQTWTSTTAVPSTAPGALTVTQGTTVTTIATGSGSLSDTIAAINSSTLGLTASAVKTAANNYQLQVTSKTTGTASDFSMAFGATNFSLVTPAADAKVTVGGANGTGGFNVTSATNTFDDVLAGTSFTVSQQGATATVTVGSDTAAITAAVQGLVTAANAVLSKVSKYTDNSTGSTAALRGDWSLNNLASQVLKQVSTAVSGKSAAIAGLQLNRYGALTFDATKFASTLSSDPASVQQLFGGSTAVGADNIANSVDDTLSVDGIGARLQLLAGQSSDSVSGMLTNLAKGQDTRVTALQKQIADWDLRLAQRKETLTAQFAAMETALGTLQSQSSWLSSQLNSLSSSSSSKSS